MRYSVYELLIFGFVYSFGGWLAETAVASGRKKKYQNRGFASGPFCYLYGVGAVVITLFLQELRGEPLFLFVGSLVLATLTEWLAGKLLERMNRQRWWDYSRKRWNLDGYICLQYSLLWGCLGTAAVLYGNDLIQAVYHLFPPLLRTLIVWGLAVLGCLDILGSWFSVRHLEEWVSGLFRFSRKVEAFIARAGGAVADRVERRLVRVYPVTPSSRGQAVGKRDFAELFWLFVMGSFLGDLIETVFCRLTMGTWMSRSSVVWGPFSVVWGLAIMMATALLYRDRDKPDGYIFVIGTVLGGAYEYICSVFTELAFGTVFWDYSGIPFNLGGRINLLYCFFWGIAAVIWIKKLYPRAHKLICQILDATGHWLTVAALLFMLANLGVSVLALARYDGRRQGLEPRSGLERLIDLRFGDDRMERIYPNAITR